MSRRKTTEEFIEQAKSVHGDKYDYSIIEYKSNNTKIKIICHIHGVFEQAPYKHIIGRGCSICAGRTPIKNNFIKDGVGYIELSKNKYSMIDVDDFESVSKHYWSYCSITGYAVNHNIGLMHRFINNTPKGIDTDHKNLNKLDNRKSNLRNASKFQNMFNKNKQKGIYTSIYKGVHFNRRLDNWVASIWFKNKYKYLGHFNCEIEAAKAYDKKAKELFGEFAVLNIKGE